MNIEEYDDDILDAMSIYMKREYCNLRCL